MGPRIFANDSLYEDDRIDGEIFVKPNLETNAGFEAADMDCAAADATSDVTDTCGTANMVCAFTIFPDMDSDLFDIWDLVLKRLSVREFIFLWKYWHRLVQTGLNC